VVRVWLTCGESCPTCGANTYLKEKNTYQNMGAS